MLIQISNRCDEGCPHCLQDSREDGGLMSIETFKSAVRFGCETGWHLFLITGGEPTMHPDMEKLLRWFDDMSQKIKREFGVPIMFVIATNGTWIEDAEKRRMMWRIARLKSYLFTQVYTNKRWYQDYDYIQDLRTELEQIPHCKVDEEHIWMQDLGRARTNADCQAEVEKTPTAVRASMPRWQPIRCATRRTTASSWRVTRRCVRPASISTATYTCRSRGSAQASATSRPIPAMLSTAVCASSVPVCAARTRAACSTTTRSWPWRGKY